MTFKKKEVPEAPKPGQKVDKATLMKNVAKANASRRNRKN